jgi:hypothetical protein
MAALQINRPPSGTEESVYVTVYKKPTMLKQFYITLLFCLSSVFVNAQCYEPISLENRIEAATIATVGRVVSSEPFYNNFGEIYTKHVLSVDRIVAANGVNNLSSEIEFFTIGGVINEEQLIVSPSPRDLNNADGLFLFTEYTGNRVTSDTRMFRLTAVQQSYMAYEAETGNFADGSVVIGKIEDVEEIVEDIFGTGFTAVSERGFNAQPIAAGRMMPSVSSISPLAVSAGVGDIITVNGSGFGGTPGNFFFDNPDDGPGGSYASVSSQDIISWSNVQIRVRVISRAGGGSIAIQTSAGQQVISNQQLDIDFAVTNLTLSNGDVVTPRLVDDEADGSGGYSFLVSNSSANNGRSLADDGPGFAALTRAVTTWQMEGDYNFRLQGTTAIQQPSQADDVNIISYGSAAYDFDDELGNGTVGVAFTYYSACGSSEFELVGADVMFRRPGNPNGRGGSVNYNFGPGAGGGGDTDFESVVLHEIGHTHLLKHVADASEVMSYRITAGQSQRVLSVDAGAGADVVANLALAYNPPIVNCGGDFNQVRNYVTFSASNSAFPVSWAEFVAVSRDKTVDLQWRTASESENDFFTVERSTDGESFRPIAEVPAHNLIVGAMYEALDESPLPGVSYYRIAQTDFSGGQSFSDIRKVSRSTGGELVLYPNPVEGVLTITDTGTVVGTRYTIYDGLGRQVRTTQMADASGRATIDLHELAPGQYVLRSESGKTKRFIR